MSLATREAFNAFRRAPVLGVLSITTIAFSLFAFGLFGLVALNIRKALAQVEDRVEVRAFVVDGTPAEATSTAIGDIQAFPEVLSVTLVSSEQALERARRELGEFSDIFDANILPASLDVRLKPGFRDPVAVRAVAERLKSYDFTDDVRYGEEWVQKLHRIRTIATLAGAALGLAFAGVAVIIIGSTIRMSVLARAKEISIMRLVGATDSFVRRPFLIDGVIKGTLGGLLALLLTWLSSRLITTYVIQADFFDTRLMVMGVFAGALLGLLGSAISVGRHLRAV